MTNVAFFRNLNLGHRGSPTSDELVAAFGGPTVARNFQTNGTVLFASAFPRATADQARRALRERGYQHHMVVRATSELGKIVTETPEAAREENVYRTMISFFDTEHLPRVELPARSRDQLVELRRLGPGYVCSVCWKPRSKAGCVTGFLETLLNAPVTTRTLSTMRRLIAAEGPVAK